MYNIIIVRIVVRIVVNPVHVVVRILFSPVHVVGRVVFNPVHIVICVVLSSAYGVVCIAFSPVHISLGSVGVVACCLYCLWYRQFWLQRYLCC